jgi:hypothetical protein
MFTTLASRLADQRSAHRQSTRRRFAPILFAASCAATPRLFDDNAAVGIGL